MSKEAEAQQPKGRGRPRIEVDPERVRKLAQAGYSQQDIAETLGVSARTLRRNCVLPLRQGTKACSNLLKAELVDIALKGNVQALIFACKTIGGLREDGPTAEELEREPKSRGIIIHAACDKCGEGFDTRPPGFQKGLLVSYKGECAVPPIPGDEEDDDAVDDHEPKKAN